MEDSSTSSEDDSDDDIPLDQLIDRKRKAPVSNAATGG